MVKMDVSKEEAEKLKATLEAVGGVVEVKEKKYNVIEVLCFYRQMGLLFWLLLARY